jgi:putative ATP-grasp target RiPP
MTVMTTPYGVSRARFVEPEHVDQSVLFLDPVEQISMVREGSALVPALKHSTGKTSTNTARDDAKAGGDSDTDATED